MKVKVLFFSLLLLSATSAYSQLLVNADGSVTFSSFKAGGFFSGSTGNSANANVSFGFRALSNSLLSTYDNTAVGSEALFSNTTGNFNSANGSMALYSNTTGSHNIASGAAALADNTTGSFNVAVGSQATSSGSRNNAIAIGYQSSATASNQARIGNSSITSIGGYAGWTNISDSRIKKNIQTNVPGLSFINQLQPITYNLDLDAIDGLLKVDKMGPRKTPLSPELEAINKKAREDKEKIVQTGFIAQDVEKSAQSLGYDFSGVDVDEIGIYGLRYAEFVVPLVKAVQELSAQVNELTALVTVLQAKDADPTQLRSGSTGEATLPISGASLQQNTPNPFSQSTVIRYTLPKTDKPALIIISNTAGNIVKQIPLDETGSVTIEAGSLSAGIYYYSLYVGNGLIDTKKMILTK
jgi:hypothetical protein